MSNWATSAHTASTETGFAGFLISFAGEAAIRVNNRVSNNVIRGTERARSITLSV
jgi:hypothetical protein